MTPSDTTELEFHMTDYLERAPDYPASPHRLVYVPASMIYVLVEFGAHTVDGMPDFSTFNAMPAYLHRELKFWGRLRNVEDDHDCWFDRMEAHCLNADAMLELLTFVRGNNPLEWDWSQQPDKRYRMWATWAS